ncbi:calcium motive P-type ATPase [Tritrichomonas foetus]|uniref:Calcium-transporting ATPase n=1 Tax=Tritrichomonas foetus TaxID=1144522 RepID=A0A1J4JWW9_9EUKA|nr:calcium motive P-type ATPase [Tritrichomonas foetus]|eukprot:OHT02030.1 calcium motive P-type ATPase [Tritrichomonas foetus]
MSEVSIQSILETFERCGSENASERFREMGGLDPYVRTFNVDLETGLSAEEKRSNFEQRRQKWGINVLPDPPKESWCHMFIMCFEDLMLKILIISAILSVILTSVFPPGDKAKAEDFIDTISIFVAVFLVAIVQTQTNYAQQKSFMEINKLKNEYHVSVIRCGEETQITNTELLVGDILTLKNGDKVAADGLFISGHNLKVNNSQETGESCAVSVSEDHPWVLGGGAVESGDGKVLVCAVGQNSQSGSRMMDIQQLSEEQDKSPLEKKLDKVAVMLTYVGLAGALLTFIVLLIFWIIDVVKLKKEVGKFNAKWLNDLVEKFMVGVTIFICAVPEGLPLAVTLSLGFSMKKMMKDNNFVRHLNACETMGGATTICSDKTGTLTQNKMTVVRFYMDGEIQNQNPRLSELVKEIFTEAVAINSTAFMTFVEDKNEMKYVGSSSECALLQMLPDYGVDYKRVRESNPAVIIHEFSSARKKMSTIIAKNGKFRAYVKGAPDFVLKGCTRYLNKDGQVLDITENVRNSMLEVVGKFADQSLRTMLIAYKDINATEKQSEWDDPVFVESNLIVIATVGIQDPLRPEVKHAIEQCNRANVIVRMVTGDYINTARAISRECGILEGDSIAMLGEDFAKKSKLELIDILPKLRVLARSSPRDKLRLVSILMESGEVVAVTGDGSNDSPALKKANVGLSMGLCGTELAKMASDIVILDDNFNSIVSALKWGRCVYDNVRGFLQFQLTVNFTAMIIAFIGSCVLHNSPLKTIQLLWVNLIMDSLGALALATRGPSDALLNRPPYGESDGLISNVIFRNISGHVVYQLLVLFLMLFGAKSIFLINEVNKDLQERHTSTLVFNTFVYMQVFNLINARVAGQDMSVMDGLFMNPYFLIIFFAIAIVQAILTELAGSAFLTVHLNWKEWLICIGFGAAELIVGAILRCIRLKDTTTQKLNALRAQRREQMKLFYANVPGEMQWEMNMLDGKSPKVGEFEGNQPNVITGKEKNELEVELIA